MPKSNNFDLLRLLAALQVAAEHSLQHLNVGTHYLVLRSILQIFPGVPVFFFVSGVLISKSFERNPSISNFARNRFLRIYPALAACFVVSIISVVSTGYFRGIRVGLVPLAGWAAAQLSFLQFYNPQFMRHYGTGVLNGSMWTISVELQFYFLTPALHRLSRQVCRTRLSGNVLILALIAVFLTANRWYFTQVSMDTESTGYKIVGVSFVPWFYMFLAGVLVQTNFDYFYAKLAGKLPIVLPLFLMISILAGTCGNWRFGNAISPLLFAGLILTVFTAAFSFEGVSDRLLRRNDISYGVYIYHMPMVNFLLVNGLAAPIAGFFVAMAGTVGLAAASWFAIERPALTFKKQALYSHAVQHR